MIPLIYSEKLETFHKQQNYHMIRTKTNIIFRQIFMYYKHNYNLLKKEKNYHQFMAIVGKINQK